MVVPNTYIIGAPKCGTTSLVAYLKSHPDIFIPDIKEPFFWSQDIDQSFSVSKEKYLSFYVDSKDYQISIDASTSYCWSEKAILKILEENEKAKFIFMIRNPINMAFSWHAEMLFDQSAISNSILECWNVNFDEIASTKQGYLGKKSLDYKFVCSLGNQLNYIKEIVPKQNLLIITLDDLKRDPSNVYNNCLKFLNLEKRGINNFQIHNSSKLRKDNFASRLSAIFTQTHNYNLARYYLKFKDFIGIKGFGINKFLSKYYLIHQKKMHLQKLS